MDQDLQQKIQKALTQYLQDKNSVKEFYPCTKKLSAWLEEKGK